MYGRLVAHLGSNNIFGMTWEFPNKLGDQLYLSPADEEIKPQGFTLTEIDNISSIGILSRFSSEHYGIYVEFVMIYKHNGITVY